MKGTFAGHTQKLDDGWPESIEEQGLLLLVWRHHITKQYRCVIGRREEEYQDNIAQVKDNIGLHRKHFYTQTLLHTEAFTHRPFYNLLHAEAFTHRSFYTQTLLHTEAFTHRPVYNLLHAEAFTHRRFYTQTLLYTSPDNLEIAILPQLLAMEPHFMQKGRDWTREIAISPQLLATRPRFMRKVKGLRLDPWNRNFTSVFGDRTSFRAKGLRFVPSRWHCPCPCLQERNRKEGEGKRARGQEEKMWGCEDERMWRCEDVKMRGCEDEKMWRCEDVKMRRWENVKMWGCEDKQLWRCEDVKMRGCEDVRMWRWEDEKMWRCEDVKMWRWEDEKMFYRPPLLEEPWAQTLSGMNGKHHPLSACFFLWNPKFSCQLHVNPKLCLNPNRSWWNHVKCPYFRVKSCQIFKFHGEIMVRSRWIPIFLGFLGEIPWIPGAECGERSGPLRPAWSGQSGSSPGDFSVISAEKNGGLTSKNSDFVCDSGFFFDDWWWSMVIYGYAWIFMDVYGYLWWFTREKCVLTQRNGGFTNKKGI